MCGNVSPVNQKKEFMHAFDGSDCSTRQDLLDRN